MTSGYYCTNSEDGGNVLFRLEGRRGNKQLIHDLTFPSEISQLRFNSLGVWFSPKNIAGVLNCKRTRPSMLKWTRLHIWPTLNLGYE